jgi:hypothetical protein
VQEVEQLVSAVHPDWYLARSESLPFGEYRAFTVPSQLFGQDVLE